ncbi:hypothetical protein SAMN05660226_01565 [Parapedobacter luteus]|uniref:DUF4153 domain-containing protein n=1 Tax=Parapedobacter luteus TaxID=623280 RepID=A0A1T5BLC0_9SPHI|nr:hypothetical protein [Parapedobacter luteus]SKB47955.1 hypothetical protein SAMN05660226_01565 [Parapedobacter luteus]
MKDEILTHLNDPRQLEKLYRANKSSFKQAFNALLPQLKGNTLADYWNERLNYENEEINRGTNSELLFVITASLLAGIIAKLPAILAIDEEFFYSRNIGFVIFPLLTTYFACKNKPSRGSILFLAGASIASLVFINSFPDVNKSDTLTLACLHLPLLLWSLLGLAFVGKKENDNEKRLGFLKYNGDLIVMTTLIVIAGVVLTGITIGLFSLIGFHIEQFYFQHIGVVGLAAAPIVATHLTQTNPQLVSKVSPVIAKLFSPIVLAMQIAYLIAIIYSGKNPYNDREFLLIFNVLLVGVMAIIFFSIAETSGMTKSRAELWILFLLAITTIIVNGIALSAILFRISEWGITPNRAAVLGANVLILANLLSVAVQLFRVLSKKANVAQIGNAISFYLPIYCLWTIVVTFIFPLIFGFS